MYGICIVFHVNIAQTFVPNKSIVMTLVLLEKSECSDPTCFGFPRNHEAGQWYLSGIRIRDAGIFELNLFHRFVCF
jgi:hypothetical protein